MPPLAPCPNTRVLARVLSVRGATVEACVSVMSMSRTRAMEIASCDLGRTSDALETPERFVNSVETLQIESKIKHYQNTCFLKPP